MIGDINVDIETAINAKIKSVGCEWGFRGKEELVQAGATYTVSIYIFNDTLYFFKYKFYSISSISYLPK